MLWQKMEFSVSVKLGLILVGPGLGLPGSDLHQREHLFKIILNLPLASGRHLRDEF